MFGTKLFFSVKYSLLMSLFFGRIFISQIILFAKCAHSYNYAWNYDFHLKTTVCKTYDCKHHASYIANLLNHSINPCNDFYDFVCSNWQKQHPVPPSYPEWKVDSELEEIAFDRIRKILEDPPNKHDFPELKKAKDLYKDCTDIPSLGKIDGPMMRSHVEAAGDFPLLFDARTKAYHRQSWLKIHNYYLSLTGESALFNLYSHADSRNEQLHSLLHIAEIKSPYGLIQLKKRLTYQQEMIYRVFLATAVNRVTPQITHKLPYIIIERRLSEVLSFRDALIRILSMRQTNEYNLLTIKELSYWYNQGVKGNVRRAHIPWISVISSLYNNTKSPKAIQNMRVNLKNKPYFRALARLLDETQGHVIVNHIHLHFIERHLELDSYLYKMLLDVIINHGKLQGYLEYSGKHWQACITCNIMREVLTRVYVQKYLPLSTRKKIQSLITSLQSMLSIQVDDCTWLDKDVLQEAKILINNLKLTIEFEPDTNDTTHSSEYPMISCMDTAIVDVFYSRFLNCISISATYFEPPIYSPNLPDTITLGSIGAIFGHEMYHAFESIFEQSHSTTSKHFCCSKNVANTYSTKTKCFVKQFDKVPVEELEHIKPIPKIDGRKTLNENIADSMGLRLAYQTFRKKMWVTGTCEILPNLPDITCDQLFFISFASSFCASTRVDKMLENLETEEHITPRLRVNGAVSNMKEFSKVFHCPENSPMNPRHKCNLWE